MIIFLKLFFAIVWLSKNNVIYAELYNEQDFLTPNHNTINYKISHNESNDLNLSELEKINKINQEIKEKQLLKQKNNQNPNDIIIQEKTDIKETIIPTDKINSNNNEIINHESQVQDIFNLTNNESSLNNPKRFKEIPYRSIKEKKENNSMYYTQKYSNNSNRIKDNDVVEKYQRLEDVEEEFKDKNEELNSDDNQSLQIKEKKETNKNEDLILKNLQDALDKKSKEDKIKIEKEKQEFNQHQELSINQALRNLESLKSQENFIEYKPEKKKSKKRKKKKNIIATLWNNYINKTAVAAKNQNGFELSNKIFELQTPHDIEINLQETKPILYAEAKFDKEVKDEKIMNIEQDNNQFIEQSIKEQHNSMKEMQKEFENTKWGTVNSKMIVRTPEELEEEAKQERLEYKKKKQALFLNISENNENISKKNIKKESIEEDFVDHITENDRRLNRDDVRKIIGEEEYNPTKIRKIGLTLKQADAKSSGILVEPEKRLYKNKQILPPNIAQRVYKNNKHLPAIECKEDYIKMAFDNIDNQNAKQIIQEVIAKVNDPNIKDENGNTILMLAVNKGDESLVKMLLAMSANPNINNNNGFNSVHLASSNGHYDILYPLIMAGGDVNLEDIYGNTPYMYAAAMGDLKSVKLLTSNGGNILQENANNVNAIAFAKLNDDKNVLNYMSQKAYAMVKQGDSDLEKYHDLNLTAFRGKK